MKKTNYTQIADKYDDNKYRNDVKKDFVLEEYLQNLDFTNFKLLDLACGTGLYLKRQMEEFDDINIEWYGLDTSQEMLEKARKKLKNVNLEHGFAEDLPYKENSFDYIINNYAFHHFEEKGQVLDEIKRVLKKVAY